MARFTIYSADGSEVRYTGEPRYNGSYMSVPYIEFSSVASPYQIDWSRGDYVDYYRTGLRYRLYSVPLPTKQARGGESGSAFVYSNVQLFEATKDLEIALFRDLVPVDNEIHFSTRPDVSTYEDVHGIARRIQACMDDIFPGKWRIEVFQTEDEGVAELLAEAREFSVSNGTCLDALSQIYETWKNVGWIHTYDSASGMDVITIGRTSVVDAENTTDAYVYGKGMGLTSLKKGMANEVLATRIYAYGSERNIQTRHYNGFDIKDKDSVNIVNLMMPVSSWGTTDGLPDASKAYVQADDAVVNELGLVPRIVYFDGTDHEEIYPTITGLTCAEVRQAMIDAGETDYDIMPPDTESRIDKVVTARNWYGQNKEETEQYPTFVMAIPRLGFDIEEYGKKTEEGHATISMKSGMCRGREFVVKSFDANQQMGFDYVLLTLEREWDDSLGMSFPNDSYPVVGGDEYVLLDIPMPDYYITIAEIRLQNAAYSLLADYSRVVPLYEPSLDPIVIKAGVRTLREGMYMHLQDADLVDSDTGDGYVLIDTLSIDESGPLPTYRATLREQKHAGRSFGKLEEMIDDVKKESKDEARKARQYTDRRFRSAQETMELLEAAFSNFSEGISPVTVQTMSLMLGDQSLQYRFTESRESMEEIPCPISYAPDTLILSGTEASLIHMTMGLDDITSAGGRSLSEYRSWDIPAKSMERLSDPDARYVYVKANVSGTDAEYVSSETAIGMNDVSGYYHFLVGILNSLYDGDRSFVPLYGFTEILPGQITTDVIRSADGETYFDLSQGVINGKIRFTAGSSGLESLEEWASAKESLEQYTDDAIESVEIGGANLLRNSGFTGDYLSEQLADEAVLEAATELYSAPFDHWTTSGDVSRADVADVAQSGYGVAFGETEGTLSQDVVYKIINGESYTISFKGMGTEVSCIFGGVTESVALTDSWERYTVTITAQSNASAFSLTSISSTLCDIQLEAGTKSTSWSPSQLDNASDRAYYQSMKYLSSAIADGSTDVSGGLVLTEVIRVGDYDKDSDTWVSETGGINGIVTDASDDVAFWAGGTLTQATETMMKYVDDPTYEATEEEIATMAKFVVTHGGRAILNDMILRGYVYATGGKIGNINLGERGLEINDEILEGEVLLDDYGLRGEGSRFAFQIGNCGNETATFSYGEGSYLTCTNTRAALRLEGRDGALALNLARGMVAGLRPNIVVPTESTLLLTGKEHTVIASSSVAITLEPSPQNGQTYEIVRPNANATVTVSAGGSETILLMHDGVGRTGFSLSDLGGSRQVARLVFSTDLDKWICWHQTF